MLRLLPAALAALLLAASAQGSPPGSPGRGGSPAFDSSVERLSPKLRDRIFKHGPVVGATDRMIGWKWGGLWPEPTDYQHLSEDGT